MGIYGEVPGEKYRSVPEPWRDSAVIIEASSPFELDYAILRPGWFTQSPKVDYQSTQEGEPFQRDEASLNTLSDVIASLELGPTSYLRCNIGVRQ